MLTIGLTTNLLIDPPAKSQMRHLQTLQQLITQKTPNPKDLASTLNQLTSVIGQALWKSKLTHPPRHETATTSIVTHTRGQVNKATQVRSNIIEDHEILLQALLRTFLYILRGLDKLAVDVEGATLRGQVIYDIVRLFREALDCIATCGGLGHPKKAPKKGRGRIKKTVSTTSYALSQDDFRLRNSKILVMMLASLNLTEAAPNNEAHQQIFEGFFFVLLESVGRVLRLFVFPNNECDRVQSIREGSGSNNEFDEKLVMAKASAPSLIWILERAILLFDRNMRHTKRSEAGLGGFDATKAPPSKENQLPRTTIRVNLAEWAKRRLQHTLLKGFFGGDADFADALDKLKDPELNLNSAVAVMREDDVSDWFKWEVERLVGWDVLTSCIAWDEKEDI